MTSLICRGRIPSFVSVILLWAISSSAVYSPTQTLGDQPCRGPDETSDLHILALQEDAAETASDLVADWETAGFLPVEASEITLVTDYATCAAVVAAFNVAGAQEPPEEEPTVDSLYVIRVGTRYVAFDPAIGSYGLTLYRVFDDNFVHLTSWLH